jgi:UDP-N-acetylmuramyl pentapeptide phosphotransferase/UDP-N-acetylglucosamine-1-phosphate transferase
LDPRNRAQHDHEGILIATSEWLPLWAQFSAIVVASGGLTFLLIIALRPLLERYALAHPNTRSSHTVPTPQGGGIAVIASTIVVAVLAAVLLPRLNVDLVGLGPLFAMTVVLAAVGISDDIRPMEVLPRLLLQTAAVSILIYTMPVDLRILPVTPWWIERVMLIVGSLWFMNLVNFMDGIDWMTAAEVVPLTAGLALFGWWGALPSGATLVALALFGATIGFAPFNRPIARLFLGDVGSLPMGLLLSWLLVSLAGNGQLVAALLLPLYYFADATVTLLRRLVKGESILQAHRTHYYQQAMAKKMSVHQIVGRVFFLNIALVGLAALVLHVSPVLQAVALAIGIALVAFLLWNFASVGGKDVAKQRNPSR